MSDFQNSPAPYRKDTESYSSQEEQVQAYTNPVHPTHTNASINQPQRITSAIDYAFEDPELAEQISRIHTHVDPKTANLSVNEADPWKYPIDADTGFRIVEFVENDTENPMNWTNNRKWFQTVNLGIICFTVAFASGVITGDMEGPQKAFHVSLEVVVLTVSLFVVGFGVGPLVFAPFSEEFGRQIIYNTTLFVAVAFILPCALARNIGTLLIGRLLSGIAFSAPMTLIGGSLSDIWKTEERGVAMAVFSAAPFLGPVMGPLIGGYIGDHAGWRWIYWVMLIFSGCVYVLAVILIPETHHATLLRRRAKKLIKLTGDDTYRTKSQLVGTQKFSSMMKIALFRPFQLFFELIVFLISLYMSVIYSLLYLFFFAYPVVFMEGKGWSAGKTGLTFIPIAIGVIVSSLLAPWINKDYNRRAQKFIDRGETPPAELRLYPMMLGCWLVPIGLFIFAWTSYPRLDWVGPTLAGFPCGLGFLLLYNAANNYLVDSYQHYAASALAAKTCARSFAGAGVVLGAVQLMHMSYQWGVSILAFVSLGCCAIPYLFFWYGAKIREKSKYAYNGY